MRTLPLNRTASTPTCAVVWIAAALSTCGAGTPATFSNRNPSAAPAASPAGTVWLSPKALRSMRRTVP